jgi:glycosyltransferase involved in cell wall biosynthesis
MKKININCPVGKTGYGITSLNILKKLSLIQDLEVSLFPIGQQIELNSENEKSLIQTLIKNSESFDGSSPCLKIWHQFDLAYRIGTGDYYSFPFFEIDKLKTKEKYHLNSCDNIFVASAWAKQVLEQNDIIKPIYIAPLGVDLDIFKPSEHNIKIENDNYIFFHIGKWEHRKGQDFLIKAFESAFDLDDKVELWLMPHNPFLNQEENKYWIDLVNNCKLKSKIKIFDRVPTQYHVAQFIENGDCGVFLSRAEGWNNEILETMALNKPIITTNYSAHTEYCNENNSFLIYVDETEPANDGKWFFGEGNWAKLGDKQLEQTVNYMRNVYKNNIITNQFGYETAQKYSWINTVQIIYDQIFKVK